MNNKQLLQSRFRRLLLSVLIAPLVSMGSASLLEVTAEVDLMGHTIAEEPSALMSADAMEAVAVDTTSPASATSTTTKREPQIGDLKFRVAPGWKLTNSTTTELSTWPIAATWDSQNNLIVAESAGVQGTVMQQLETRPHRVVRLIDTDKDGVFDKREIVAEQLPFPEGVLCVGNDILVSAPPQIIRLIDADCDGKAESRSVWHDGKTITGCANDLHGPFLGPDGWLYWCKAAFAEQTPELSGPFPSKSSASHLYRKRLNDTTADRIMTGGMDNLVDVTFNDLGERFFVATFLHHPGGGVRDGLGHAPYGAVYGKPNAVLQGHPRTGPLFKPMVEMGPAAPAGVLAVSNATFPTRHDNAQATSDITDTTLVAAQFNLQRVSMHELSVSGADFDSRNSDLIVSDQLDFHPVDVLQDIDGSLIVVDTGGWYDLCCPSSGSEHRIAPGGIYRLTPESAIATAKSPATTTNSNNDEGANAEAINQALNYRSHWDMTSKAWSAGDWKTLLLSPQKRVREWGTEAWLQSGASFDEAGKLIDDTQWLAEIIADEQRGIDIRASAFWAMARWIERHDLIDKTPEFVHAILGEKSHPLQNAALNLVSTYRWKDCRQTLEASLDQDQLPMTLRLTVECLGRIGNVNSLNAILNRWQRIGAGKVEDRTLEHAFLFSLLEIASYPANRDLAVERLTSQFKSNEGGDNVAFACLSTLQQLNATTPDLAHQLLASLNSKHHDLRALTEEVLATQPECFKAYLAALPLQDAQEMLNAAPGLANVLKLAKSQPQTHTWVAANILAKGDGEGAVPVSAVPISAIPDWKKDVLSAILVAFKNQALPIEWDKGIAELVETQVAPNQDLPNMDSRRSSGDQDWLNLLGQSIVRAEHTAIIEVLRKLGRGEATSPDTTFLVMNAISASPRGTVQPDSDVQVAIVKIALGSSSSGNDGKGELFVAKAWQTISKLDLEKAAWELLVENLEEVATNHYPQAVEALAASTVVSPSDPSGDELATRLITRLIQTPGTKTLTPEQIQRWFQNQPEAIKTNLQTKLVELFAPPADMAKSIQDLTDSLPEGDAFRGQDIFRSSTAACSACHRIGYVGGNLGPELTRIGRSRSQRDLIEAILYPSHRIEQGFTSTNILTMDDEVITGLITFEDETRIEVAVSAEKKVSINKSDIQERATSTTSLMPAGIDKLLTAQEIADLLAFLQQAK